MTTYAPGFEVKNQANEQGTLGCFARTVTGNPAGAGVPVLLSAAHVLFGSIADQQDVAIYEPTESGTTCSKSVRLAKTLLSWAAGFRDVTIRVGLSGGTTENRTGAETDCAIARLEPGVHFSNDIPGIGTIKGTPPTGNLGVVEGPPFGTAPLAGQYVRFFSPLTKHVHFGTILKPPAFTATYVAGGSGPVNPLVWPEPATHSTDEGQDMKGTINQILILPRPDPIPNQTLAKSYEPYLSGRKKLLFGQGGDSGSVVVNSANQVIGLISRGGGEKPPSNSTAMEWLAASAIGIVCPIEKVLAQMQIEIPATPFSGVLPQAGPIDLASPGALDHPEGRAMHDEITRLRERVSELRLGRVLLGMITRHNGEVRRIVNGRRPALAAWQHNQGPAYLAHLIRALRDPSHQIPTAINGVPRTRLLEVMAAVLTQYGSPRLRRDIERYRDVLLRHAPMIVRLDDVPEAVARMSRAHLGSAAGASNAAAAGAAGETR
jgi:hypothetical protein